MKLLVAAALLDLLISGYPSATTQFGGISPKEAADRHALSLSLRAGLPLTPSVDWVLGASVARHWWRGQGTTGAGLIPAGLRIHLGRHSLAIVGGVWLFDADFPVPQSGTYAFTGDIELLSQFGPVLVGGSFSHWSNAKTARRNPGLNAWQVIVGYRR